MKCPHCTQNIKDAAIIKAHAAIVAKRRRKAGNDITSDQARALQARSVEARRRNKAAKRQGA